MLGIGRWRGPSTSARRQERTSASRTCVHYADEAVVRPPSRDFRPGGIPCLGEEAACVSGCRLLPANVQARNREGTGRGADSTSHAPTAPKSARDNAGGTSGVIGFSGALVSSRSRHFGPWSSEKIERGVSISAAPCRVVLPRRCRMRPLHVLWRTVKSSKIPQSTRRLRQTCEPKPVEHRLYPARVLVGLPDAMRATVTPGTAFLGARPVSYSPSIARGPVRCATSRAARPTAILGGSARYGRRSWRAGQRGCARS